MKKTAMKISGIITMIFYFLLLVVSGFCLCTILNVEVCVKLCEENEIISGIFFMFEYTFISAPMYVLGYGGETLYDWVTILIGSVIVAVCLLMFFWGIKETKLSNRDDFRFARCFKTCALMNFIKFLIFAYFTGILVYTLVDENLKIMIGILEIIFNFKYLFLIVFASLSAISLVIFLLPVINILVVRSHVRKSAAYNQLHAQHTNSINGEIAQEIQPEYAQQQYQQPAQPTMQANMPPMPGYTPQTNPQAVNQPVQQPVSETQTPDGTVVAGQNGVPENITQKGLEDLQRLERLKSMGAITPENYEAMKQKICSTNIN
ncbi:MAG: SHOCT domain-containing protein [Clostridia bacterium]|nr:SHOCT domain-containing protein [Clostridia bacterium]